MLNFNTVLNTGLNQQIAINIINNTKGFLYEQKGRMKDHEGVSDRNRKVILQRIMFVHQFKIFHHFRNIYLILLGSFD